MKMPVEKKIISFKKIKELVTGISIKGGSWQRKLGI
jgi:hypothetical protein